MLKVAVFYAIFTPITTIGGDYLVEDLSWNDYLVTGLCMLLNFVLEFLYDKFFVFNENKKEK